MPTGHYERHNQIDMTGQIIGYTKINSLAYREYGKSSFWNCTCLYNNCGNNFIRSREKLLKHREDANCGCYSKIKSIAGIRKRLRDVGIRNLPHGKRLDEIFHGMQQRCENPNSKSYKDYGGRGIKICKEWKSDKKKFYEWAIQNGYTDELTIDRIDTNGDYEPSNCRWATYIEQNNNTRAIKKYDYKGGKYSVGEISRMVGIRDTVIYSRLKKGFTIEQACEPYNYKTGHPLNSHPRTLKSKQNKEKEN